MKLLVFSHKECWYSPDSPYGWATDGGFVMHMDYLAKLFETTEIFVPVIERKIKGEVFFTNHSIKIKPIKFHFRKGLLSKLYLPFLFLYYLPKFVLALYKCDAVHAPIPSNIGTFGFVLAHIFSKPLYIRHCGNFLEPKSKAEKFWKWYMEKYAGKKRVFLATGGLASPPSKINENIKWIFSTSLTSKEIEYSQTLKKDWNNKLDLCIVCRQEKGKGVDIVIEALSILKKQNILLSFNVVGDGDALPYFKELADRLKVKDQVTFYGKKNHEEVMKILSKSHIFCYPTKSDGFPKVVLEAMSQGLIIVTTPVSVLASLIPDNNCGYLLENVTPDILASKITDIVAMIEENKYMSNNAILGAKKYTLENWANTIGQHLENGWKVKLNAIKI